MNTLLATVTQIQSIDTLNIVHFECLNQKLSMMSLDLNDTIQVGTKVSLTTKPSHVVISKDFQGSISFSNQLRAKIKHINNGQLLSSIQLSLEEFNLESIITLERCKTMDLKINDEVIACINASELSILRVL